MKHITILVPAHAILGSIEGPRQVFTEVNKFLTSMHRPAVCQIQLAGLHRQVPACGGKYTVFTDALISDIEKTDLVIIPALDGDMTTVLEKNRDFIPWIVQQYRQGAEVASLCVGAFLLAATGLADGKRLATHWMAACRWPI